MMATIHEVDERQKYLILNDMMQKILSNPTISTTFIFNSHSISYDCVYVYYNWPDYRIFNDIYRTQMAFRHCVSVYA